MTKAYGCPVCFTGSRKPGFPKKEDERTVVEYDCGMKIELKGPGNKVEFLKICKGKNYGK